MYLDMSMIIWTTHSLRRLIQRGISKEDVESVIQNPIERITDESTNNYKCFGILDDSEPKYLIVIYTISNKCIKIITAMNVDAGGVKTNGFTRMGC